MGKFGHKNKINLDILSYNIGLLGEAGIGKSTLMKTVCEKLAGQDGYIALDIGKEDGHAAISGIITEKVENYPKFKEILEDIIENKDNDYPNLKAVIIDTFDQLCELAEKETIREYNKTAKEKVKTINQAYGGFGRGMDHAINMILDDLWELKKVGVSFIIIAHVKKSDITDVMSEEQYSVLTSNTTQKYFNAIKQKLHFLGLAYIDREIVKEKTKKKDKDGNYVEKGRVAGESRVINFRDDTYSVDSKSRFAEIIDKIPFDADAFINALKDAILKEQAKDGISLKEAEKNQKAEAKKNAEKASEYSKNKRENPIDEELNAELIEQIKTAYKAIDVEEKKATIKTMMEELGAHKFSELEDKPTKKLQEILAAM